MQLRTLSKNRSFSFVDEAGWMDLFGLEFLGQEDCSKPKVFSMGLVRPKIP